MGLIAPAVAHSVTPWQTHLASPPPSVGRLRVRVLPNSERPELEDMLVAAKREASRYLARVLVPLVRLWGNDCLGIVCVSSKAPLLPSTCFLQEEKRAAAAAAEVAVERSKWASGPKTHCVGAPLSVTQASLRDQLARWVMRVRAWALIWGELHAAVCNFYLLTTRVCSLGVFAPTLASVKDLEALLAEVLYTSLYAGICSSGPLAGPSIMLHGLPCPLRLAAAPPSRPVCP
jgi:hypothetical protein